MAFTGRWETETQEGYDEFCKLMGTPDNVIEETRDFKVITEITQDGDDFTWTLICPNDIRIFNKFTLGKECDMLSFTGKEFKATVHKEGDKMICNLPNCLQVSEISAGKLIETSTCGSVVMIRTSKKI